MSIRQTEKLYGYLVAAKNIEIEYEHYHGSYDIEPTFTQQVLATDELVMDADLIVEPIPYDIYDGPTTASPLPNDPVTIHTEKTVVMDDIVVEPIGYDISDTNVSSEDLRLGKTAIDHTGEKITGTWNPPDVSSDTVTQSKVLAGTTFHDSTGSAKVGNIPTYSGPINYTANPYSVQTINCYQKYMNSDIRINKIPYDITTTNVAPNKMLAGTTAISPAGSAIGGLITTYSGSTVFDPDPTEAITIPVAGKYVPTDLTINPGQYEPILQTKTVTPTDSSQNVTPDAGYDGLSNVTIDPIPSQYIVPSGSINVTDNGTVDVTQYASVVVNVSDDDALALSVEILGVI